jgi:putative salt-induced outer membrane protein YdiY
VRGVNGWKRRRIKAKSDRRSTSKKQRSATLAVALATAPTQIRRNNFRISVSGFIHNAHSHFFNFMQQLRSIASLIALAVLTVPVSADEVRLKDGTVVKGVINSIEAGTLSIVPGYNADGTGKAFKFKLEDIISFNTDEPLFVGTAAIESKSADNVAYGKVESTSSGIRVITSTGTSTASVAQIKAAWRTPMESPQAKALDKLARKWTLEFATDLRGKTGNSDQIGAAFGFTAVNSGQNDTLTFRTRYNYQRTDNNKSADDLAAGMDYESRFTESLLWYARTNDGYNKLNQIDFFAECAVGGGMVFINKPNQKLETRLGAGYRYEALSDNSERSLPSLDVGVNYQYSWKWGKLESRLTYMPAVEEFGDYRIKHESYVEFPIAQTHYWRIRMGMSNDYNSRPQPGVKRLDTTYFTRIVLNFK